MYHFKVFLRLIIYTWIHFQYEMYLLMKSVGRIEDSFFDELEEITPLPKSNMSDELLFNINSYPISTSDLSHETAILEEKQIPSTKQSHLTEKTKSVTKIKPSTKKSQFKITEKMLKEFKTWMKENNDDIIKEYNHLRDQKYSTSKKTKEVTYKKTICSILNGLIKCFSSKSTLNDILNIGALLENEEQVTSYFSDPASYQYKRYMLAILKVSGSYFKNKELIDKLFGIGIDNVRKQLDREVSANNRKRKNPNKKKPKKEKKVKCDVDKIETWMLTHKESYFKEFKSLGNQSHDSNKNYKVPKSELILIQGAYYTIFPRSVDLKDLDEGTKIVNTKKFKKYFEEWNTNYKVKRYLFSLLCSSLSFVANNKELLEEVRPIVKKNVQLILSVKCEKQKKRRQQSHTPTFKLLEADEPEATTAQTEKLPNKKRKSIDSKKDDKLSQFNIWIESNKQALVKEFNLFWDYKRAKKDTEETFWSKKEKRLAVLNYLLKQTLNLDNFLNSGITFDEKQKESFKHYVNIKMKTDNYKSRCYFLAVLKISNSYIKNKEFIDGLMEIGKEKVKESLAKRKEKTKSRKKISLPHDKDMFMPPVEKEQASLLPFSIFNKSKPVTQNELLLPQSPGLKKEFM